MEEEIDNKTEALFGELVKDKTFIATPHGMVLTGVRIIKNMLREIVRLRQREEMLVTAKDKDAMADLEILLWEIKKEKEK